MNINEIMDLFHNNSGGLPRLDRFGAGELLRTENLTHPVFGLDFRTYQQWCEAKAEAPHLRVLLAIMANRFRIDKSQGHSARLHSLHYLWPKSYKIVGIKDFLSSVRLIVVSLDPQEVQELHTSHNWFDYLYDRFRDWPAIKDDVRKIRRSESNSQLRTWKHLMAIIDEHISESFEDANYNSIHRT